DTAKAQETVKDDELPKTEDDPVIKDTIVEEFVKTHDAPDNYKQHLKLLIQAEVQNILDEEIKKTKQELLTEHRKAITQLVQEHKSLLRELVEEEKKAILDKSSDLKESLLLHLSEELNNDNI
ncbi:hypothetical protein ACFLXU_07620, partial [Chloroflexota bacterium]